MPGDGRPKRVGGSAHVRQSRFVFRLQRRQVAPAKDAVGRALEDELAAAAAQDELRRDPAALSH
jgi:hypothetical protein